MVIKACATRITRKGKDRAADDILRLWGTIRVIDAPVGFSQLLILSKQDITGAVAGDPENCAWARCCRRVFGNRKVLIYRSVAYIEMNFKGAMVVMRFQLSKEARNIVESLDCDCANGKSLESEIGKALVFKSPRRSIRFANRNQYEAERRARRERSHGKKLDGVARRVKNRTPYPDGKPWMSEVRNGSGHVRFAKEEAAV